MARKSGGLIGNFFDAVTDAFKQYRREKIDDFSTLVRAVVENRDFDPADAAAILDAAGKTPEDLKAAVDLARQRDTWRAMVADEPKLRAERSALGEKAAMLRKEFEEALKAVEAKHQAEFAPINARILEIDSAIHQIVYQNPAAKLLETSPVWDETRAVFETAPSREAAESAEREHRAAVALVANARHELRQASRPVDILTGARRADVEAAEKNLAGALRRLEQAEAKLAEVAREQREYQKRVAQAEVEALAI